MTELTRASTLSLRRPGAALASRAAATPTVKPAQQSATGGRAATDATQRNVHSETLLQGRGIVGIVHNGETYQLRATRLGKLILTK